MTQDGEWSNDIETVLDAIRSNSALYCKEYKKRHFALKATLRYFKLPVIIISAISSIVSVGLQPYVEQGMISMSTCLLGLLVSVIGSVEMYLKIQQQCEEDVISSREFQILAIEIFKTLSLTVAHRPPSGRDFLEKKYDQYVKLIEQSNPLSKRIVDALLPIPTCGIVGSSESSSESRAESPRLKRCDSSQIEFMI